MTRPIFFRILIFLLISSLFGACADPSRTPEHLMDVLKPVREKYAPDRRVAVFSITPEWQNGVLVVKGEVDDLRSKAEALAALRSAAGVQAIDSVMVLPDPRLGERRFGIVTVSVGSMRAKPGQPEELVTQTLMGMVVNILKRQGGWYYVQTTDKYLGWIEDDALAVTDVEGMRQWALAKKVIMTGYFGVVRERPEGKALPVTDVVTGVLLSRGLRRAAWTRVSLPDGRAGYLENALIEDYDAWRKSRRLTAENVERAAKMFIGVPYLWGGTSAKGFDCSGYTKTVYRINGVELNRDANQQALMGEDVVVGREFEGLKKGDLLFFGRKASGDRPERIWHVAIYLGSKRFIHCSGRVKVNSLDPSAPDFDADRLNSFVRARRVVGISPIQEVG